MQSIAHRLTECSRVSDTVSRQGGDEFVVLLSEIDQAKDAAISAERMLKAVADRHSIDGHDLYVTTSIGISVQPHDGVDGKTLIKNADTAVYRAKANGTNSYQLFEQAMNICANKGIWQRFDTNWAVWRHFEQRNTQVNRGSVEAV